jgi:uroporphyrinogen-III synthase
MPFPRNAHSRAVAIKPEKGPVDLLNEKLAPRGLQLHPTKGYRRVSLKRAKAELIVGLLKNGHGPLSTKYIAAMLQD